MWWRLAHCLLRDQKRSRSRDLSPTSWQTPLHLVQLAPDHLRHQPVIVRRDVRLLWLCDARLVQEKPSLLPAEKLREQRIGTGTTVVLLGDSVIRGTDLSRSTESHEVGQKMCVPGVTFTDLSPWLQDQPSSPPVL